MDCVGYLMHAALNLALAAAAPVSPYVSHGVTVWARRLRPLHQLACAIAAAGSPRRYVPVTLLPKDT